MNTSRLIQISVALTDGEFETAVFWRPWTIHGWRPLSVKSQPAVFIRNGVTTAHTDSQRNNLEVRSLPRWSNQPPHNANSRTSDPRPAITRIDQYWIATFGT